MIDSHYQIWALLCCAIPVLIAAIFFARKAPKPEVDDEPPCVPALYPIPYIGHIVGIMLKRTAYYAELSKRCNLPIFSLSILGGKVYVIGSPQLIQALHRQPWAISFWFMEASFTVQLGGLSKASADALQANLHYGDSASNSGLLIDGLKATQRAMSSQGGLDKMVQGTAAVIKSRLDNISAAGAQTEVDLWAWVQHEVTAATTESIYGPMNPYRDPRVESAFWDFADDSIMMLVAQYLPAWLARKGLAGRAVVVDAVVKYFESGGHRNSSPLMSARYAVLEGHMGHDDMARFECVNGIAILANSVPTAFWTIFQIFSEPKVLAELRNQIDSIVRKDPWSQNGRSVKVIPKQELYENTLLFSIIQEALRLRATGTGPRMIMNDTSVGGYRLRKDATLIIANQALHYDRAAWGADANSFIADRFSSRKGASAHAFRGFGGGVNLCPGKAYAMMEISAFVAMLVMRFDVVPRGDNWEEPSQDLSNMSLQIAPPKKKVITSLVPRPEEQEADWKFDT